MSTVRASGPGWWNISPCAMYMPASNSRWPSAVWNIASSIALSRSAALPGPVSAGHRAVRNSSAARAASAATSASRLTPRRCKVAREMPASSATLSSVAWGRPHLATAAAVASTRAGSIAVTDDTLALH